MAAETDTGEEKTEAPTGKRRGEARSKGQVAKSQEISSVTVIGAGLIALWKFGFFLYDQLEYFLEYYLKLIRKPIINDQDFLNISYAIVYDVMLTLLPFLGLILISSFIVNAIQVGGIHFATESIKPSFSKLNPIAGLKRLLWSPRSAVELLKSLAKLAIVGFIAYITLVGEMDRVMMIADMEIRQILVYILDVMFKITFRVLLVMIFLAALDYLYNKYEYEKNLKMTKMEIKEENKQSEGDPQIKAKIKSLQREMARKRMMESVPKADVVVTNPVHLAVALQYDSKKMKAPTLLAKGAGIVAENIKSRAREHRIPIVENKKLAQSIFRQVEIGHEIPSLFYQAVAEVLAYVYKLKGKV